MLYKAEIAIGVTQMAKSHCFFADFELKEQ